MVLRPGTASPAAMTLDHLTLPRDTPPLDHVARALLKRGARDQALRLLRAAVDRDPREKSCAALLRAVEARPGASVYGPEIGLDVRLAEVFACCGWFQEALSVLEGAGLDRSGLGRSRAEALREILSPIPASAKASLREVDQQIRHGSAAAALAALDQDHGLPSWAIRRRVLLRRLLLDSGSEPSFPQPNEGSSTAFGVCVRPHLEAHDLATAHAAAVALIRHDPSDANARAGARALARLRRAIAAVDPAVTDPSVQTPPMSGLQVAMYQLGMGNLESAERLLRHLIAEEPEVGPSQTLLHDLLVLRASLAGRAVASERSSNGVDPSEETLPGLHPRAQELRDMARALVLAADGPPLSNIRATPVNAAGAEARADGRAEAERAESLFDQGFAEQALTIYRRLMRSFPERRHYAERADAIRMALEQRLREASDATGFSLADLPSPPERKAPSPKDLGVAPTPPSGTGRPGRLLFGAWVEGVARDEKSDRGRPSSARDPQESTAAVVHVRRIVRVT